ncbi:MAG: hypothetical protein NC102_07370 [Clostridium sp.]|nr:hypothetical protein [Clostridium sp.]
MAFIPPIVAPLLQMVKDLTAALNETRQYLGLPPIDAQALIDKAYASASNAPAGVPPMPISPSEPAGVTPEPINIKPIEQEPKQEPAAPADAPTPDGKYSADALVQKNGNTGFDPKKFVSNGIFQITISGGKATFTIKSPLSDMEIEDWETIGVGMVAEGPFNPFVSNEPITDTPGQAKYIDGIWVVTDPAEIS